MPGKDQEVQIHSKWNAGFSGHSLQHYFQDLTNRSIQLHSSAQPTVSPEPSMHHPCFSLNANCTITTMSLVQVFLQKESKRERKQLKLNFQDNFSSLRMAGIWVIVKWGWIHMKYSSVWFSSKVTVPINVKLIPFRAHWSPALYLPACFASVTSSYILCPEHEASFLPSS